MIFTVLPDVVPPVVSPTVTVCVTVSLSLIHAVAPTASSKADAMEMTSRLRDMAYLLLVLAASPGRVGH